VLNGHDRALGIRPDTRQTVIDTALRLGYRASRVARTLRRRRSNVVALLVQDLANPCFVDIAVAARAAAEEHEYEVSIVDAGRAEAEIRALDRLRDDGSDGVIVATGRHGSRPTALKLLRELVDRGLQAVVLLDRSPDRRVPAIRVDVEAGAVLAVEHLLSLGHRRIAHLAVAGPHPIEDEQSSQGDRYRGYRSALRRAGIDPDPSWVVRGPDTLVGGCAMAHQLFDQVGPKPTAILVYNDLTAIGVLRAMADRGLRVPQDVAIVGTDGIELGQYTTPSLTTVDHPRAELGRRGVETLCALLAGTPAERTEQVLVPQLIVRESCGA
jgi:DNA-binding LacI/PurR family transcriptional regulator